jgi:RND family efflux transporter MFP subunit
VETLVAGVKLRKKTAYVIAGVVVIAAVAAVVLWREAPVSASTFKLEAKEFAITLRADGELKAVRSVTIAAPMISGRLQIIRLAQNGTAVKPGDVVVEFDPTEKIKARDDAAFDLRSAEQEISKMKAQLEDGLAQFQIEFKRAETEAASAELDLVKREAQSRIEADKVELRAKEAAHTLARLKERMAAKQRQSAAELETLEVKKQKAGAAKAAAERDLEALTVKSPISGLLVFKQIWKGNDMGDPQEGDTVWPGMAIAEIPDLSTLEVNAFVHESDGGQLKVGQAAKVLMDAFPDREFEAKVARLGSLAQRRSWNNPVKYFTTVLALESSDPSMRPGMTTSVDIVVETIPSAISVPLEAVVERDGEPAIYVKNGRGFEMRHIKLGKRNSTHVVIENGVKAGEEVALRDPTQALPESGPGASSARPPS